MCDKLQDKSDERQKREREEVVTLWGAVPVYTPLKKQKGDDFASARKQLIKKLSRNEVKTLQEELQAGNFSIDYITKFFEEEYHAILSWLLIGSENTSSFQFILDAFTPEAIKRKLRESNFSLLVRSMYGRAGMEELGHLTTRERILDRKRFELLLRVDFDGIQDFMKRNKTATFMKPSTWEDYEIALQSYNATKRQGAIPPTP